MVRDKNIVIGITGGIAAYKMCDVISQLKKRGYNIYVIMTESATRFVNPLTFQTLSQNLVYTDMWKEPKRWDVEHIELAKKADLFLVAPATANFIGKVASGISDDMLTTTVMATKSKVMVAPAMNTNMYTNPVVQQNMAYLREVLSYSFIESESGVLACGDVGVGKLASVDTIVQSVETFFEDNESVDEDLDLKDIRVLVTAGGTIEAIDPVRYITNRSTGKMGYSIAKMAIKRGAKVTLISGKNNQEEPLGLYKFISIESADELYEKVRQEFLDNKVIIQSAAVADYKPAKFSNQKIKKSDDDLVISLTRNKDIAKELGKIKGDKVLVGFAAETNNVIENARSKVFRKNLDFIVANDLTKEGAGFKGNTNIVTFIDKFNQIESLPKMAKEEVATKILDKVKGILVGEGE